jgi:hypothetical protein
MPSGSSAETLSLDPTKIWVEEIAVRTLQFPMVRFPTLQGTPQLVPGHLEMRVAAHGDKGVPALIKNDETGSWCITHQLPVLCFTAT